MGTSQLPTGTLESNLRSQHAVTNVSHFLSTHVVMIDASNGVGLRQTLPACHESVYRGERIPRTILSPTGSQSAHEFQIIV
jgi:hypothetical protein